jgi:hypothetical protein|tara:strand:- start:14910 stop:15611 length:702 start_codon:yes stop_codon:yes gene_type:complete
MDKQNHAWSYSSINVFAQCPRRWLGEKIEGFRQEETEALRFGSEAHTQAEMYGKTGKAFTEEFSFMEPFVKPLVEAPGDKHYEMRLALTSDLEPCDFFADDCWWRGIADLVNLLPNADGDPTEAVLIDYKTGKNTKFADIKQLQLLSLGLFHTFPSLETIKGALLFVMMPKKKSIISGEFHRKDAEEYWEHWDKLVSKLQFALLNGSFPPKKNALCKSFCPVTTCYHNGKYEG